MMPELDIEESNRQIAAIEAGNAQQVGFDYALGLLAFPQDQDEARDWAKVPQELRGIADMQLPSYKVVGLLRAVDAKTPDYCRDALTYLAIYRPGRFEKWYHRVMAAGIRRIRIIGGEWAEMRHFPPLLSWRLWHWANKAHRKSANIMRVKEQIDYVDTYCREVFAARKAHMEYYQTSDEEENSGEYEKKHEYQVGGSTYQEALMIATYGQGCESWAYGHFVAMFYHASYVRGL